MNECAYVIAHQCFIIFRPNSTLQTLNANIASMWIKIISSWICVALYIWTLVARPLFPDRDFD